jgi:WD40 repeat protein
VSPTELASASTDSTLRLWDVQNNRSVRLCLHFNVFQDILTCECKLSGSISLKE